MGHESSECGAFFVRDKNLRRLRPYAAARNKNSWHLVLHRRDATRLNRVQSGLVRRILCRGRHGGSNRLLKRRRVLGRQIEQAEDNGGSNGSTSKSRDWERKPSRLNFGFVVEGDVDARDESRGDFGIGCDAEAGIDGGEEGLFFGESGAAGVARSEVLLQGGRELFARSCGIR